MADLERPTRSAASFGPMEVLLTIAHLVLCTVYRMERGGVQLIGLLYSWQIWFHPWEGWLRRGRKAGTTWQLALPREQVRQTVERRLCAQFLTIWLFVVCNRHSRRKEAVEIGRASCRERVCK